MAVEYLDIEKYLEQLAPGILKEDWDNIGLLVGESKKKINKVLIALDCVDEVVEEAVQMNADIIITHHPVIFKAEKSVTDRTPLGKRLIKLIKNNISVYSAHTNLDVAVGGTNDTLFDILELNEKENLMPPKEGQTVGLGRIGTLTNDITLKEFIDIIKERIGVPFVSYVGNHEEKIKKVGICTGAASGREYIIQAKKKGCQAYLTGDITFHTGQFAVENGICLLDATHYYTEVLIVKILAEKLRYKFSDIMVIESSFLGQTLNIV